jgi:branched-chain amino acid transport system substrate-binding protein
VKALGLALLLVIPRASILPGDGGAAPSVASGCTRGGSAVSAPKPADPSSPGQDRAPRDGKPFKSAPQAPLDFRGPGREQPEPDVDEVVLGWFGPGDPDHPEFGDYWRGATLALEQENAAGGYRGKPFRLVPAWSESPWKAGIVDVTRLVQERGAWAVIGGVDGTTTHLAVQIALKSHFLLLSPGSTDATTDHANVPWLFSLPPSDEQIAPVLAGEIGRAAAGHPFAVAAATDHESHAALVSLRRALDRRGLAPSTLVEVAPLEEDLPAIAGRLRREGPRVMVVLAPSRLAGRLVAAVRGSGYRGAIVGGAPAGRSAFRRAAGEAAEGVIAPVLVEPGPAGEELARAYERRWGEPPDEAAAHGYDAVRLVAAAVRRAGLNRALVRDAVRALAPWPGASGSVAWNALGRGERPVALGAWRGGRLSLAPAP